jgi:RNA polymerase sigma-70 factor (ECF subfamily)
MAATRDGLTDRDWMVEVANGDLAAFERLYRHYEKRIYQYVYLLAGSAGIAEDVVGETMLAVWRGASGFAHASRVSTWILGIARHKAVDALRRAARDCKNVPLDEAGELPDPVESAADGVSRGEEARVLRSAIDKLSREHQEVLRLVFYEELPYEEIAALLKIPLNTVKTRVYYAKQQLKLRLEP